MTATFSIRHGRIIIGCSMCARRTWGLGGVRSSVVGLELGKVLLKPSAMSSPPPTDLNHATLQI